MSAPSLPRQRRGVTWVRWLLGSAGAGMALFLLAAGGIVLDGLHDHPGHADLAVVLGNEVLPGGQPSARLAARLDRVRELYVAGGAKQVLVSGAVEPNGYDEAEVMAAYLEAHGVPADHILQDNQGVDSYATARNTRRILRQRGWQSVCVVKQYYHVPRACLAMRHFGINPVYSAHARYFEWRDVYATAREVAGWVKYSFRRYDPA